MATDDEDSSKHSPTRVAYILVTFRRTDGLRTVVAALPGELPQGAEVVVVHNGGTEDVEAACNDLTAAGIKVTLLEPMSNIGSAGATELAMRLLLESVSDECWIGRIDDDLPPRAGVLREMLAFAQDQYTIDGSIAGVGVTGANFNKRWARLIRPTTLERKECIEVDFVATGHFPLFRAAALRSAGVMDGRLFYGLSEVELGLRLRRAGYKLMVNARAWRAMREESGKTSWRRTERGTSESLADWRRYYSVRNLIFILKEYDSGVLPLVYCSVRSLVSPLRLVAELKFSLFIEAERLAVIGVLHGLSGRSGRFAAAHSATARR